MATMGIVNLVEQVQGSLGLVTFRTDEFIAAADVSVKFHGSEKSGLHSVPQD